MTTTAIIITAVCLMPLNKFEVNMPEFYTSNIPMPLIKTKNFFYFKDIYFIFKKNNCNHGLLFQ